MMTNKLIGVEITAKGISVMLTALLNTDVQLQYSACGCEASGQKKKSFCDTMTFKCMRDILVEKFSVSEKEIVSKTSRWFTGASDRAGGRKERNRPREKEIENRESMSIIANKFFVFIIFYLYCFSSSIV
ncbi:PREDICTED: uncharacterized protein LOC105561504 [Vollenhovia emeryi]|uniref:uncharacterized protein LOC105561504 n=1 Tax=Vollenhovia emeryi TaxID=411798 RepID=UPI0005F57884|nr:PREDICTED: uncharacterized protein LOC105561504 [Vollenhovia emeryi]